MIKIDIPCRPTGHPLLSSEENGVVANENNKDYGSSKFHQLTDDQGFRSSFTHLLKLYSMYLNKAGESIAQSGGLQQLFIKHKLLEKSEEIKNSQPRKGYGSETSTVHNLPDSIIVHIFSFLDAKDLCRLATVCQHWYAISCDNILWRNKLHRDVFTWEVVGHRTNPDMYKECESDWTNKEIYLRCSPEVSRMLKLQQENDPLYQISTVLKSFWPKKTPKLALFGPGLESSTSSLVRKIIYEDNPLFQKLAMFPGKFGGLGSGFTLGMKNLTFHLTTLYTSTREERLALRPDQRLQHNRMLAAETGQAEGSQPTYQLRPAMQDLCRTLDAFVFVVDASQDEQIVSNSRHELFAMVNELWAAPDVAVMVLSCVKDSSQKRMSCIQVVRSLQLNQLNRPWEVRDCTVDDLLGIQESIEWVVHQAQKR